MPLSAQSGWIMGPFAAKKIMIASAILGSVLLVILLSILFRSPDKTATVSSADLLGAPVKGFSFLDLHADSILTDDVRNRLKEILGSEAIETNTVLDLELHYPGLLERYFPALYQLNKQLNYEGSRRVRIEHNTTKLIYRYSKAFHYVELFFSNDTRKPLLFRIRAKRDGSDYLATLRQKYGKPQEITWKEQRGKSLFWHRGKDVLILSLFPDQYDQPQFEIMICHVGNIENLLTEEKKEGGGRKSEQVEEGRKLF